MDQLGKDSDTPPELDVDMGECRGDTWSETCAE